LPSEKSARASERKREQNQPLKTSARSLVTKADQLISQGAPEAADAVKKASVALDKAAQKGALHPNNASRRKGRLAARLSKAGKQPKQ
jgi:small subunit ribosomal protein S20